MRTPTRSVRRSSALTRALPRLPTWNDLMRRGQPLPWQVALTVALRGPDTVMFESQTP